MYKYYCLNNIAEVGIDKLHENFVPAEDIKDADGILVRSENMQDMDFSSNLKAIARAGAGVNNIPIDRCSENGIVVFNTPGANANGVKELVLAGMLLAARDIIGGIEWVKENKDDANIAKTAEKAKKAFAGNELEGKKLGVVGLGAIGVLVANAARNLGMDVYGYDPYLSVDSAWRLSRDIYHITDPNEIYRECDFISIHVPMLESTKGMINKEAIAEMKEGVVVMNLARAGLVDAEAIVEGLESGKVKRYVTDFPIPEIVNAPNTIIIPHLGASTEESEENCARMAGKQLRRYLENGNIKNSVNFPNVDLGVLGDKHRLTIIHKNVPNMLGQITKVLAKDNMNIRDLSNKSRGAYAYTMLDIDNEIPDSVKEDIERIEHVIKVRVLQNS